MSASSAKAIAAAVMRQSPVAVGAPTASIDIYSAATTRRDAVNNATCPSEPTTRVDISSVCVNVVDKHRCDSDVRSKLCFLDYLINCASYILQPQNSWVAEPADSLYVKKLLV